MPEKPTKRSNSLEISQQVLDQLLEGYRKPEDLFGTGGIFDRLKERLVHRILEGELTAHLGFEKHDERPEGQDNARNGYCPAKTVKTDDGELQVRLPRDREGSFEPVIVPKNVRRLPGFDDAVIHLYAKGMTVRDIEDHLREIYKIDVSPALISDVTNEVLKEISEWQNRPLDEVYPIVYLDALMTRVREGGRVVKKAVYIALGVNREGDKELLGMWIGENEGAKFWLGVLTELKNRGLQDILIACVDGLTGFPDAIEAVYPKTKVQLCIVHMVRNSLKLVNHKQRREVAMDLKTIYQAPTEKVALQALKDFTAKWDGKYPMIAQSWTFHWENLRTFFDYPPEIRRVIYTTNAIESLNHSLRKVLKNRKSFPNDEALLKALYLGLKKASEKWTRPVPNWGSALNQFAIEFGARMPR
jgi:putative transposase